MRVPNHPIAYSAYPVYPAYCRVRGQALAYASAVHAARPPLQYCDRVIGVRAGEIVFDGPAATITQEQIDFVYNGTKAPVLGDGE